MPSDKPLFHLLDVLENIDRIQTYTENYTLDRFVGDPKCQDAVERCLLRISEAARKLQGIAEVLVPDQPWSTFALWEMYFVMSMTRSIRMSYGTSLRVTSDR